MANIKQQISSMRQNTPRHVQWLMMAAAFVVVLILLTLLIGGWAKKSDDIQPINDNEMRLLITPADTIDWSDTPVGATREQKYIVTATMPAKILQVHQNQDVAGVETEQQCTTQSLNINESTGCFVTVKYNPTAPLAPTGVTVSLEWRGANEPDNVSQQKKITLRVGAVGDVTQTPAPIQQPVVEPTPAPSDTPVADALPDMDMDADIDADVDIPAADIDTADEYTYLSDIADQIDDYQIAQQDIIDDIELISPSDPFIDNTFDIAPVRSSSTRATRAEYTPRPETCSDFAIPGYDLSGHQFGWIKPVGGAYYFHPFSDTECKNATGVYNPDNGIITDIKDRAKKIGTDAEHIGYAVVSGGTLPKLTDMPGFRRTGENEQYTPAGRMSINGAGAEDTIVFKEKEKDIDYTGTSDSVLQNTIAQDRSFILRQYKPIPATIVSDIRADVEALQNNTLPVRATVDRNVYADNGRTVVIPAGTLLMGYVTGKLPGPYTAIGRMQIKWYQFVLPNGMEFNFGDSDQDPFSADAQGRTGVPGRGSTDYLEQFVMPMLTAIVPAAVNMIAPIADRFVNQIDLDNNTVVQSGTVRSSELAKNEIITAWNQVAQKLMVDMMDNTVPPFSIAAGTRITVFSPVDLMVTCGDPDGPNAGKKCAIQEYSKSKRRDIARVTNPTDPNGTWYVDYQDGSWEGQVRSFKWASEYCEEYNQNKQFSAATLQKIYEAGLDYRNVLFFCQSNQYQAINNARQDALYQNQQEQFNKQYGPVNNNAGGLTGISGSQAYNEGVLGLTYDEETNAIVNPFVSLPKEQAPATITCEDGTNPDTNGCCTGETYTDMGDGSFACCPAVGEDCFPPIL